MSFDDDPAPRAKRIRLQKIVVGTLCVCLVVIAAYWYSLTSAEEETKAATQERAEAREAAEKKAGDEAWKRLQETTACLELKLAAAQAEQRGEHVEVPQPCRDF